MLVVIIQQTMCPNISIDKKRFALCTDQPTQKCNGHVNMKTNKSNM